MDNTLQAYEVRSFWIEKKKKTGKIFSCVQRPAKSPLKEHCIYGHESRVCVFIFDLEQAFASELHRLFY